MYEKEPNKPILKLADNIPVTLVLEIEPLNAKYNEKELKTKDGVPFTSKSYTYFVNASDPVSGVESKMVWFAKPKEHDEMVNSGAVLGGTYEVVNRKYPGDKYAAFIVRDKNTTAEERVANVFFTDEPPLPSEPPVVNDLESFLVESPESVKHTAIVKQKRDPTHVGWALKTAIQSMGPIVHEKRGYNGLMDEIKVRARELMAAHHDLSNE